jgi:hypothetical protein
VRASAEWSVPCPGGFKDAGAVHSQVGVDIEPTRLVMARYCNEPARLGSLY